MISKYTFYSRHYTGFGQHVLDAVKKYPDAPVDEKIWQASQPKTSFHAHLICKAVSLVEGERPAAQFASQLRKAFFVDNADIGRLPVVLEIAASFGVAANDLQPLLDNGAAAAALMLDYQKAQELAIKGSPSWIMNEGRQTLYGNVGYRVLNANIKEFLERDQQEASWC